MTIPHIATCDPGTYEYPSLVSKSQVACEPSLQKRTLTWHNRVELEFLLFSKKWWAIVHIFIFLSLVLVFFFCVFFSNTRWFFLEYTVPTRCTLATFHRLSPTKQCTQLLSILGPKRGGDVTPYTFRTETFWDGEVSIGSTW